MKLIEQIYDGCLLNGERLIRCCVCGEVRSNHFMTQVPNETVQRIFVVCKGSLEESDCEAIAKGARRVI